MAQCAGGARDAASILFIVCYIVVLMKTSMLGITTFVCRQKKVVPQVPFAVCGLLLLQKAMRQPGQQPHHLQHDLNF